MHTKRAYTLYTAATHGLISDQILGGVSEKDSIQWIATGNGIMSSTLGGNYPLNKDTADFTVCARPQIKDIEDQLSQPGVTAPMVTVLKPLASCLVI